MAQKKSLISLLTARLPTAIPAHALAQEPAAWFRCEGAMISEGGIRPQNIKGIKYGPGIIGQAAEFAESASVVYYNAGLWSPEQGTFAAWIKPRVDYNADNGRHDILSLGAEFLFFLAWTGPRPGDPGNVPGSLMFVTNPTETVGGWLSTNAAIGTMFKDNGWHHVAISWGPEGKKVYVDGVLKATAVYQPVRYMDKIHLGKSSHFGQEELFHVNSWLDEIRFYTVQLSDADIKAVYEEEKPGEIPECATATYDFDNGILHVPNLFLEGRFYWLDLRLLNDAEPFLWELKDWGIIELTESGR